MGYEKLEFVKFWFTIANLSNFEAKIVGLITIFNFTIENFDFFE